MLKTLAAALIVTASAGLFTTILPTDAHACGNSMHRFKELPTVSAVERAWGEIENGQHQNAIGQLATALPGLDRLAADLVKDAKTLPAGETRRALHGMAVAVVRSDGAFGREAQPSILAGAAIKENVLWATEVLAALGRESRAARVHHAEALAQDEVQRARAHVELEKFAQSGDIVDTVTWVLLADLRREGGDKEGADAALVKSLPVVMKGSAKRKSKSKSAVARTK